MSFGGLSSIAYDVPQESGGFWSSIGSGIKSGLSFLGDTVSQFAESPAGGQFLGGLAQYGLARADQAITGRRSTAGGPSGGAYPPAQYRLPSSQLPRPNYDDEYNAARRGVLERSYAPPVPSTQPYGYMPGAEAAPVSYSIEGGPTVPFPTNRYSSYPPSPAGAVRTAAFAGLAPALMGAGRGLIRQMPAIAGGVALGEVFEGFAEGAMSGGGTPMFRPTMAGYRAQVFRATNPATGADVYFKPAGKPILWSSDLSACKRVRKVAARARRKR